MEAGTSVGLATRQVGGVTVVELDDGKVNAFSQGKFEALEEAIVASSEQLKPVVIAGRPGFFTAGLDLGVVKGADEAALQALREVGDRVFATMRAAPVPIVAACAGHALAAGAVILMCCDLRIGLAGSYGVGLVEVAAGIPLPSSIFELAERRLAHKYLFRATVLAERWGPAEAVEVGYLDRVAEHDVVAAAVEAATALGALPADAFRSSKQTFWSGLST